MRGLADLRCECCGREFYGDLSSGQALYSPQLLEKTTGFVHDPYNVSWFTKWLRESYANRLSTPLELSVKEHRPLRQPAVLLNCLDTLYGHCLLKLLNAQYYLDHRQDLDLIVMIPRFLEWMVPDGVAQAWIVDLPLRRGTEWNDWLAAELNRRIGELPVCWLSVAFSHPHPNDYNIERFTRVQPFPVDEWEIRMRRATITFIWREDRLWLTPKTSSNGRSARLVHRLERRRASTPLDQQSQRVLALAMALRQKWKTLDFAIVGLGKPGGMPDWITDLRRTDINEATEHIWCERYASSHIVIGVHGSNMLLPSAHAGAVIELVPPDRWSNILQATLFRQNDPRATAFRYRYFPLNTSVDDLTPAVSALLTANRFMTLSMPKTACDHSAITNSNELLHLLRSFKDAWV
ncbi:MAG: hypothetical protein L0287_06725 [Anaerolineae bacterium]|nr:hypothetical protein [Anaerolineae bacterium]